MTSLHCPLCGLRFHYGSELDVHAREDHGPPPEVHIPPPRPAHESRWAPRVKPPGKHRRS